MSTNKPGAAGSAAGALGRVLFGRTRQRLLSWLLLRPDEAFYLRELVRLTGAGQGGVQRELDLLTNAGILQRTVRGRHVYFQADRRCPVFEELSAIIAKTVGLVDILRECLQPIADRIVIAFVFGSLARGAARDTSDLDLLVIGDVSFGAVVDTLAPAQTTLAREVNPAVYTPREFSAKIRRGHHFLSAVLSQPKVFVLGGPDELERVGGVRMAHPSPVQSRRSPPPASARRSRSPGRRK